MFEAELFGGLSISGFRALPFKVLGAVRCN